MIFLSGTHVHSDQALVSVRMSDGMNGASYFLSNY